MVDDWIAEKSRSRWTEKARIDYRHWLKVFQEIAGDKPVASYGKADGLAFKAVLMKLPANSRKLKALRSLPYADAAEKAAALGMPPMSIANFNKAMSRVGAFFKWASANSVVEIRNPIDGLKITDDQRAQDKRDPVSPDHLATLFSSPLWRSCRSERFCAQPGNVVMTDHWRFWLPLLGLWTGARSNELGQLLLSDIKQEEGVDFLHVIDDTESKRLKTASARRHVPVHDQLKALGFLSFVAERRSQSRPSDRLFPDLQAGALGYYSDTVSKFFSGYMIKVGIKTEKTSFHSLRHNFQDACRHAKMYQGHREAIAGRDEEGTGRLYGKGGQDAYGLPDLNQSLQALRYPSVDWSAIPRHGT